MIRKRRPGSSRRGAKRSDIEREVAILREIGHHKNIVKLHNVYESVSDVILLLEYVPGGELFHHVCSQGKLAEAEAKEYIKQILLGVSYLQSRHIVHLDLKPENIMLKSTCPTHIKIIDFGLSRKIGPTDCVQQMVGTPEFVAPEVVEFERLSIATDMWAVGVISYILLSGMSPFMGDTRDATFANITAVSYDFDDQVFSTTSEMAKDFIRKLFVKNPVDRATCIQCLRHPWMQSEAIEMGFLRQRCAIRGAKTSQNMQRWQGRLIMDAVFSAAETGDASVLQVIFEMTRFPVDAPNEFGQSVLHIACGCGHLDMVRLLLKTGANPCITDKHGETPLYWASRYGQTNVVDYLLDIPVPIDSTNECLERALHIAVRYGHFDVVERLIEHGCDMNVKDEHAETPLHIACWHGFAHILELLIKSTSPNLDLFNQEKECALHCAAVRGHLECVQHLLSAGANVDVVDKNGLTPLSLTIRRHHTNVALLLLQYNCDISIQDSNGDSALHIACEEGQTSVVQVLCQMGCKVDAPNKALLSPLHMAAKEGHADIVRILCLAGADISLKNKGGIVAEAVALTQGFSQICGLLARLKNDPQRLAYTDQLAATTQTLKRIKIKLLGHPAVGKTRLVELFKTSFLGSFFRRKSEYSSRSDDICLETSNTCIKSKADQPVHPMYTRGIEVHQGNIPNCGEFSIWDFSSYQSYHQVYDHFVGNADCIHLIMFRIGDPTETQYQQVVYWLNFMKSRILPAEPIGFAGKSFKPAYVALVGTYINTLSDLTLTNKSDGEWISSEADAMLKTVIHRFSTDFIVNDQIIMIDIQQPSCCGLKLLKSYLSYCRSEILQVLPRSTGLLEATLSHINQIRKSCSFPVICWPEMIETIRKEVNPLSSENHCKLLVQQLQLIGEVIYIKGEIQDFDFVIRSPNWFCHDILGTLLAPDFSKHSSPTGRMTSSELCFSFPDIPEAQLLQLLYALDLCTECQSKQSQDQLALELPGLISLLPSKDVWNRLDSEPKSDGEHLVYGGLCIVPCRGMSQMLSCLFPRIQVHLRRSLQEFAESAGFELQQWKNCSLVHNVCCEALISMYWRDRNAIQIVVRGPVLEGSSCFYFMEDLIGIVERTLFDVAPGLLLERHFLSPQDLANHEYAPVVYSPAAIIEMQEHEKTVLRSEVCDGKEERFVDVVCMGSRDIAVSLTLGVDLPVNDLSVDGRRELAQLLDPPTDPMGRDCSILALKLGVPAVLVTATTDANGPFSPTDHALRQWAIQQPLTATVGALLAHLRDLGRQDALQAVYSAARLYAFSPPSQPQSTFPSAIPGANNSKCVDSGVVLSRSSNSYGASRLF